MTKNVGTAFDQLIEYLKHSEADTNAAISHRQSIEARLKTDFGLSLMIRSGSYGHGTSLSGISDIDYFAIIPSGNLHKDSSTSLRKIKGSLQERFPSTNVYVDSPAVVVPFVGGSRRHEIIPAYRKQNKNGYSVYGIPNRYGSWMDASPIAHNAWVNTQNDRLNKKLKQLIRLVKYWNHVNSAGIRSFYIELRVTEYAKNEDTILYPIDMGRVFSHLSNKSLAKMQDPQGISGYIYPCSEAVKSSALSKVNTALARARKAREAENNNSSQNAFYWWDMVFNGKFPAYY